MRSFKEYVLLFLKGIGMGSADVVPGVSGGTIAFITGIYDELLNSIKSIDAEAFRLLIKFKLADFWKHINGNFLIVLVAGIAISLFSLAKLITYLLETYPIQLWSFFFGLIVISALMVARDVEKKNWAAALAAIAGILIAYFITSASPAKTSDNLFFAFVSGAIAICAMILPGISGAFILLILGKYTYVLTALKSFDIPVILVFVAGCVIGLLLFSRLISWLLHKYQSLTVALLAGFMVGSLNKIWPWKIVDTYRLNSHGEQVPFLDHNVMPQEFMAQTGNQPHVLEAILFAAAGILLVVLIERIANVFGKKESRV